MSQLLKKSLLIIAIFALLATVALPVVQAQIDTGLGDAAAASKLNTVGVNADNLPTRIGTILFQVISFVGVIFLIIIVYAGFLWMTAGGNSEQTKKASTMMKNGVIGVLIVLSSYAIVFFVFTVVLGAQIT